MKPDAHKSIIQKISISHDQRNKTEPQQQQQQTNNDEHSAQSLHPTNVSAGQRTSKRNKHKVNSRFNLFIQNCFEYYVYMLRKRNTTNIWSTRIIAFALHILIFLSFDYDEFSSHFLGDGLDEPGQARPEPSCSCAAPAHAMTDIRPAH